MGKGSFTLIELLVVVAVIAILAAIAVPNFLEAQTRSKVSRVLADLRTVKIGLEQYAIDYNKYPLDGNDYSSPSLSDFNSRLILQKLTTPTAYLSQLYFDPFHVGNLKDDESKSLSVLTPDPPPYPYIYMTKNGYSIHSGTPRKYYLFSLGPDQDFENEPNHRYDASNGTVSDGDIIVIGP